MKPITQEWVNKAEGDFGTAQRENLVQEMPNYDAVCFHSQQCTEKYLKARLQEENIAFGKTHDLSRLLDLPKIMGLKPCHLGQKKLWFGHTLSGHRPLG